jgi:hypothetical protein
MAAVASVGSRSSPSAVKPVCGGWTLASPVASSA